VTGWGPDQLKDQVGVAMVEVVVPEPDRVKAMATLAKAGVRSYGDGGGLVVPAPLGARSLHGVLHELDAAAIAPERIGLRKPTLDEVFLRLTSGRVA
jgi:ABC-2 type transport system ATP-binding protein